MTTVTISIHISTVLYIDVALHQMCTSWNRSLMSRPPKSLRTDHLLSMITICDASGKHVQHCRNWTRRSGAALESASA